MQGTKCITILADKKEITLSINKILYILMKRNTAELHVFGNKIYKTRMTMTELEQVLGEGFIKVHRSCLVAVRVIHDITDKVNLSNGESLEYVVRKKKEIQEQLRAKQRKLISGLTGDGTPTTAEEYHAHYISFDFMPCAFTDIEMVFDEESRAVDWIFRYGNPALAKLEKLSLKQLIGSSFGSLFANVDSKWLRSYERATLYGEIREIIDYRPEIDTYLKVICFPTFKGHCGCIMLDIAEIKFTKNSNDVESALMLYLGKLQEKKN